MPSVSPCVVLDFEMLLDVETRTSECCHGPWMSLLLLMVDCRAMFLMYVLLFSSSRLALQAVMPEGQKCFCCDEAASAWALWGRSY